MFTRSTSWPPSTTPQFSIYQNSRGRWGHGKTKHAWFHRATYLIFFFGATSFDGLLIDTTRWLGSWSFHANIKRHTNHTSFGVNACMWSASAMVKDYINSWDPHGAKEGFDKMVQANWCEHTLTSRVIHRNAVRFHISNYRSFIGEDSIVWCIVNNQLAAT